MHNTFLAGQHPVYSDAFHMSINKAQLVKMEASHCDAGSSDFHAIVLPRHKFHASCVTGPTVLLHSYNFFYKLPNLMGISKATYQFSGGFEPIIDVGIQERDHRRIRGVIGVILNRKTVISADPVQTHNL